MNLVTTTLNFPAANNTWDAVRYWIGMSTRLKQADLACQVMAGFALTELHAANKIRRGNPHREKAAEVNSVDSTELKSWEDLVKEFAGISEPSARLFMKMAAGVKARWKDLPIRDRLHALMTVPPSEWKEDDARLISDAVHKATDGRTQLEFMWELGLAKNRPGQKGRKPGDGGRPKDMDLGDDEDDDLLKEFRQDMRLFTHSGDTTLQKCSTAALVKHQEEVTAYAARIAEILKRRKQLSGKK